ncbi:hypothetical protein NQK81_13325 [Amycolatopsis roodepoortensis]|uniref:hypothetical protein n=1 Tax=Amycolatopsis roodepoortensis TaxID=700274 RepID=UPI00214BA212|nr:hypothetical protein [Amycolatopsis roodepoortensis]UUV34386.1 hypothetical protein NQK81_13325 [Amycolatopsis roodepoortensis]
MWSIEDAARVMGMAPSEVLAVAEVGEYLVVTTSDGQRTAVADNGDLHLLTPETAAQLGIGQETEAPVDVDPDSSGEGESTGPVLENPGGDQTPEVTGEQVDEVPDVNKDELLAWVGDDTDRAARALAAENARDKPRSTVVAELEKVAQA